MAITIRLRRGTTAEWIAANPVLASAEPGVEFPETGSPRWKIGDGATAWADLPYASGGDVAELAASLESATEGDGGYTIGYWNPDGTKFNGAASVGAALDDVHTNFLRKGQGSAVPTVETVAPNDRVVIEQADGGFRGVVATAALSIGSGVSISDDYTLQADERRVVMTAESVLTIPTQSEQAFAPMTSVEILKTGSFTASIQMASGVQLNGVSGNLVTIDAAYTIVRLVRDPVAANVWYLSGNVTAEADVTPPVFDSFFPSNESENVSTGTDIYGDLNEACAFGSGTIEIYENDGGWALVESFDVATEVGSAAGQVELTNGGTRVVIHPTAALSGGVQHSVQWTVGAIEDIAGNPIAANTVHTVWSFTTLAPATTQVTPVVKTGGVVPAGSGTFNIPVPAGIQEGDYAELWFVSTTDLSTKVADLASYWEMGQANAHSGNPSLYSIKRTSVALGTLPANVTVGRHSTRKQAYMWLVFRNAEMDAQIGNNNATGNSLPDPEALTQIAANTGRLLIGAVEDDDIDDMEPPTPYERLWRQHCGEFNGTGATLCAGWRTPQGAASDSHNPGPFTSVSNPTGDPWRAVHVSYKTKAA